MQRIRISEVEGKKALCFDTGLDSRSFAQAKAAQYINEPGFTVLPEGSIEIWKAEGVTEAESSMLIWGQPFSGTRLDLLIEGNRDEALAAIAFWIRARINLGKDQAALSPSTAFIAGFGENEPLHPKGTVFFAPDALAKRCVLVEKQGAYFDRYVCPYLKTMEGSAFCAGAMLYRVLTGLAPFPAAEESLALEDMREGNYIPLKLAAPGIDEKLCRLVQNALMAAGSVQKHDVILNQLLEILMPADGKIKTVSSLFRQISMEEKTQLSSEKDKFIKRKNRKIKTKRFVMRHKIILLVSAALLITAFFSINGILKSRAGLPTTRGMDSTTVVQSYFNALGALDHEMMEACLAKGVNRSDLEMALNLFVINRVRQAYELKKEDIDLLDVMDLTIERIAGSEEADEVRYRAIYELRLPRVQENNSVNRTDVLTLKRRRGNWQITEISRTNN